jgi:hypothetical protein
LLLLSKRPPTVVTKRAREAVLRLNTKGLFSDDQERVYTRQLCVQCCRQQLGPSPQRLAETCTKPATGSRRAQTNGPVNAPNILQTRENQGDLHQVHKGGKITSFWSVGQ